MKDDIGSYRQDGSDTMIEGAVAVGPHVSTMRARVSDILLAQHGCTDPEMVAIYRGLHNKDAIYRSLGARRRELVIAGKVEDSGERRKNITSGIKNIVWIVKGTPGYGKPI